MANQIHPKLIVIDTPGSDPILNWRVRIASITWIGATTAGHNAIATDVNGNRIFKGVAGDSNDTETKYGVGWVNGVIVPTLQSGELEIVLE